MNSYPKMLTSAFYLLFTALISSAFLALAVGPRPGYVEIKREKIGEDTHIYYVLIEVKESYDKKGLELADLDKKIVRSKRAIGNWEKDLPGYMNQLDEWIEMDKEARAELKQAEINFACDLMLAHFTAQAEKKVKLSKQALAKHWGDFQKSRLNDDSLRKIMKAEHLITPVVRKWESNEQMVDTMHKIYHTVGALNDISKREYLEALANLLKTQVHDPGLQMLVADFEFLTVVTYAQVKTHVAIVRVEQLSQLGTSRLQELKSLTALYRRQIDQRNHLKKEREAILSDAKNGVNK